MMTEDEHYTVVGLKFDWTPLYGKLEEGEYIFALHFSGILSPEVRIDFTINKNGEISYSELHIS